MDIKLQEVQSTQELVAVRRTLIQAVVDDPHVRRTFGGHYLKDDECLLKALERLYPIP